MSAALIMLNLGAGTRVPTASSLHRGLEGRSVLLPPANQPLPSCLSSYVGEFCH